MVWGVTKKHIEEGKYVAFIVFLPLKMHFLDKNAIIRLLGIEITTNA